MNFDEQMRTEVSEIRGMIQSFLPKEEGFQKTVLEAVNYSMNAGGKKLRPMLMLETYRMFGGSSKLIAPFMTAIEMIHTHSLVHDDLPAVDNDEYRRGKKTTHAVYGEGMAVIAGDALLNLAYETVAKALEKEPDDPNGVRAFAILAEKTGVCGMIGGQSVDIEYAGQALTGDQLAFIYELKTSALIEASMMIGAVLAGAGEDETEQIEQAARSIGLAFQIQDDILDCCGDQETLGKPVGSDEKNQKTTYVTLKGLEEAREEVERCTEEALGILQALPYENAFLGQLIQSLIHRSV